MKQQYTTVEEFFDENEKKANKLCSYLALICIPIYPVLILLTKVGIYPPSNYVRMIITGILVSVMALTYFFRIKKRPDDKGNKYFLISLSLTVIFSMSVERGIHFSITYAIIPIFTCLYYDKRFTINCVIAFFISMIASFGLKSFFMSESSINVPKATWFRLFATGASIEYTLIGIFCIIIVSEVRNVIIKNFEHRKKSIENQEKLVVGFANIIETKEYGNEKHIKRTSEYVRLLGNQLMKANSFPGLINNHYVDLLVRAVPFYDIGKITIPPEILNKNTKLTPEEFDLIKKHPVKSAEFINQKLSDFADSELLQTAYDMALYHHERIDGSGYPYNLSGDAIPLSARILSVADILDALLSKRSYKEAYSTDKAFDILRNMSGNSLDSRIVSVLLSCKDEVNIIRKGETSK